MAKAARLYYEQALSQVEIGRRLDVSQATVSRLLKRAQQEGIVRISVSTPGGTCPALEDALQARFGLHEVVVVDASGDADEGGAGLSEKRSVREGDRVREPKGESNLRELGAAAAFYLETTLKPKSVIGISSWSSTLLAMVDAMHPLRATGSRVVQILGGVGSPSAKAHATRLTQRLSELVGGEASLLPAPGVVRTAEACASLKADAYIERALKEMETVSVALVGIGATEPSRLLAESGNVFAPKELESLSRAGAVGDICLRFFDAQGELVNSDLENRVIGMTIAQLRKVPRTIGIAAGLRKAPAIRGALRGGLINVLVTDRATAEGVLG